MTTDNSALFGYYWRTFAGADAPQPEAEYRFHPTRKWRFDFAWPADGIKLAVEIDGGNWLVRNGVAVGRHTKSDDYDKLNAAAALGWRVMRFTPAMLERDPQGVVAQVLGALEAVK